MYLSFMDILNFILKCVEHVKSLITSRPDLYVLQVQVASRVIRLTIGPPLSFIPSQDSSCVVMTYKRCQF